MKNVTMDDIARRASVSRGAVSLALRRSPKISAETTERILRVADELGYRLNVNASRLARSTDNTFGVMAFDLRNPIMSDILDGFVGSEGQSQQEMYLTTGFRSLLREREAVDSLLAHRVRGVVLIGSILPADEIRRLGRIVPTVIVGRRIEGMDSVLVDDRAGGALAAGHLVELGHTHLAHFDGGSVASAIQRKEAFRETALRLTGIPPIEIGGDYSQDSGYLGAKDLFGRSFPPTGLFAANDMMALGVLAAGSDLGLRPGNDFALVGFDDIDLAAYGYISLTSISYSRNEMGRIAGRLLQRRCDHQERPAEVIVLAPEIVVRKSSKGG